jgi:hypothetical protein
VHGGLCQFQRAIERSRTEIIAIERLEISVDVSPGQCRSGARIIWVDRQRLFEQTLCIIERRFRASAQMQEKGLRTAQVILIGLPGGRRFQERSLYFGAVHMSREDRYNRTRYLILDCENVVQFAVVSLGPAVGAGHR